MRYIAKKICALLFTLLLISMVAFFVFQIIPGDPAMLRLGMDATDAQIEALREEMGLKDPIYIQYIRWITGFLKGDCGLSYTYQIPVSTLLAEKLPVTLALAGLTFLFILFLSIPAGLIHARFMDKPFGNFLFIGNQVLMAVPSFFLGVLLTLAFGLALKWFVPGKYISYTESITGFFAYLIAPACSIALPKSAMVVKFLRSSILAQKKSDYVRTAYSKGNTKNRVLYQHILKNACIPAITILGMMVAETLAGSIVVEQVFNLPGIGRLLISSVGNRDYPVIQAIMLYIASAVVIMNTLVDILYRMIDPRIREN